MSAAMPDSEGQAHETADFCAGVLDGLCRGFLKSFHGSEGDFLRLGKALEGFNAKAMAVSRAAEDLADLTCGEAVQNAASKLSIHLGRLGESCARASSGEELSGLDAVANVGATLIDGLRDFTRLVKHLTMLGIATRIESARLGSQGQGFGTLADDVEKLAGKIAVSSGKILKGGQELVGQCRDAGRSVTEMSQARLSCSSQAMDSLRADVGDLEQLTENSRRTAAEISADAGKVVESVSGAVLSMQFHDIIRQQLEHVAEASDEARRMALDGPQTEGGHNAESWEELASWMRSVLLLQHSQLGNARERFTEAIRSLGGNLEDIASGVESMADRAGSLAGAGTGQGGTLAQIEGRVGHMVGSLREFSQLESRMSGVMREVGSSISEMSSLVSEIEEVGSEIELIALNASIKAAHTGEEGRALGVLASAIQKLSVDARGQTDRIMDLLATVDSSALSMTREDHGGAEARLFEEAVADLDNEIAGLKSLEARVTDSAGRLRTLASNLSREIREAVSSLDSHQDLLGDMASAEGRLDELARSLQAVLPEGADATHSPKLLEMLARYTMDAERLVHESVLGIEGEGPALEEEGELGGNIELF